MLEGRRLWSSPDCDLGPRCMFRRRTDESIFVCSSEERLLGIILKVFL
mgnify:CR=1 FL=1|jgi:hypothetical protein